MQHKNIQWYKIADTEAEIQFGEHHIAVIEVNKRTMCIGKHQRQLFAFAHKCPHAGGILADGWIDMLGNVVCPVHRYKFSMTNGRNTSGEGYYLKQWPVEIREAGIFVGIEESGIFNWLGT